LQLVVWERMMSRAGDVLEEQLVPGSCKGTKAEQKQQEKQQQRERQQQWDVVAQRLGRGKTVVKLLLDPWVQMMLGPNTLLRWLDRQVLVNVHYCMPHLNGAAQAN
jgi:hypothetical protein